LFLRKNAIAVLQEGAIAARFMSATACYGQKLLFVATSTSMSDRPPDVPELPDRRSLSATLAVSAKQRF